LPACEPAQQAARLVVAGPQAPEQFGRNAGSALPRLEGMLYSKVKVSTSAAEPFSRRSFTDTVPELPSYRIFSTRASRSPLQSPCRNACQGESGIPNTRRVRSPLSLPRSGATAESSVVRNHSVGLSDLLF